MLAAPRGLSPSRHPSITDNSAVPSLSSTVRETLILGMGWGAIGPLGRPVTSSRTTRGQSDGKDKKRDLTETAALRMSKTKLTRYSFRYSGLFRLAGLLM